MRLAGADVVRDLLVAVSQVEADLVMNAASRFSFTLANCYNLEDGTLRDRPRARPARAARPSAPKSRCASATAMPRRRRLRCIGLVTEISTSFPETGAPELIVSGYDHGFPLTLGKNSDSWKDRSDSDVVQLIASFHNLNAVIETTAEKQPQIEQNQESDWDFLEEARRTQQR